MKQCCWTDTRTELYATLLGFFVDSVLLSVLSVLAALGEVRPLERRSSVVGEALPSGLAVCFLRPLRSVDICPGAAAQTGNSLPAASTGPEQPRGARPPYRATVPSRPHAMLPAESILFLFDRFEHKWRRVHRLLDGGQLAVFLEVNAAVGAQQDVLAAPVVPVLGGCGSTMW